MAGTVDGSITIRTDIDTKGFKTGRQQIESGMAGIKASLGKVAAAAGLAFSTAAIINFGKAAIDVASNIEEVQNVVDTAFGSMKQKCEDFASTSIEQFGLSELTAKRTASTYMAMAKSLGFTEEAASDMAISLAGLTGDVSSFYNVEQSVADTALKSVFTGETESLKQFGVVMTQTNLDAFALQKGLTKTYSKMSQSEQTSLRYAYVVEQLSLAQGDFAKTSESWANQTRILSQKWEEFKGIAGSLLINVLSPMLSTLNNIVSALISAANAVKSFFGIGSDSGQSSQMDNVASSTNAAAAAQDNLASSTKKAAKAAKDNLQAFDELNVRQKDTSSDTEAATTGTSNISNSGLNPSDTNAINNAGILASIGNYLNPLKAIDLSNLTDSLGRLKDVLGKFRKSLFSGLDWAYHNLFVPLAEFTIEEVLPRFFDILSTSIDGLTDVLDGAKSVWKVFYDKCLKPIADFSGKKWLDFLDGFEDKLSRFVEKIKDSDAFNDLKVIFEKIGPIVAEAVKQIINFQNLNSNLAWSAIFSALGYWFDRWADKIGFIADLLNGDLSGALDHLANLVIWNRVDALKEFFTGAGDAILSYLGLNDKAIESTDDLGDEISDNTKKKVQPFIKQIQKLDDTLAEVDYGNLKIDDSIVKNVQDQTKTISDTIINELSADKNESLKTLDPLKKALGAETYSKMKDSISKFYDETIKKTTDSEAKINEIIALASKEKRPLYESEKADIQRIRDEMNSNGIKALSDTEVEYNTIMNRLKDNSVAVSVEQASEIIKNAKNTKEKTISEAEEQYTRQVMEAQMMYEAGAINEEQYNAMVLAAEKTKNETIESANNQYDTIVANTKKKLGENSDYIDYETGEVKTKWQKFCDSVKDKWGGLWNTVGDKWNKFKTDFKKGWDGFWKGIGNFFIDIWNGIVGALELAVNGIVKILNNLNIQIPDWLPIYGGKTFGFHLSDVKFNRVPRLATGAVIPPNSEFLAVLGDQRSGRNLEAPEGLIRKIVREETAKTDNSDIISAINNLTKVLINKKFIDSPEKFARDWAPVFDAESKRSGSFSAVGGFV